MVWGRSAETSFLAHVCVEYVDSFEACSVVAVSRSFEVIRAGAIVVVSVCGDALVLLPYPVVLCHSAMLLRSVRY